MAILSTIVLVLTIAFFSNVESRGYLLRYNGPPIEKTAAIDAQQPIWGEITQRLDHFDPAESRTWIMRYLENDQFYSKGGPIFIFLGGEWEIQPVTLTSGQMYELAKDNQGMMYYTEHRYYGQSYPTEDLRTENLKYLSADQALEDIAHFIKERKQEIISKYNLMNEQSIKVAVVGGSYSANLATWARLKYPQLIQAAWASSGPVRAVKDFYEYLVVVTESLALVSKDCPEVIKNGTSRTEAELQKPDGAEFIATAYNTCTLVDPNSSTDMGNLFLNLAEYFMGSVQYAEEGTLKDLCSQITKAGDPFENFAGFIRSVSRGCLENYASTVKQYRNIGQSQSGSRSWLYQTCTEFGYFQTSNAVDSPFGSKMTVSFYEQLCKDVFGEEINGETVDKGVKRTNEVYGSTKPNVTKVVSIHNSVDPWHRLGILHDLNEDAPAIFIEGTSHCMDLRTSQDNDLPQLKDARDRAHKLIKKWLQE